MTALYAVSGLFLITLGGVLVITIIGFLPGIFIFGVGWWLLVLALFRHLNPEYKAELEEKKRNARR